MNTTVEVPSCPATKRDGYPCGATILMPDGKCYAHTEAVTEDEKHRARAKGGLGESRLADIERSLESSPTLMNILRALGRTSDRLEKGEIPAATASGMASLARAMTAVVSVAEQSARLRALNDLLDRIEDGTLDLDAIDAFGWVEDDE